MPTPKPIWWKSWRAPRPTCSASKGDGFLDGNPNSRAQAPERRVAKRDVAAVGARDIARDGKPKSGAAFVLVARIVKPQEGLEHILAQRRRNTRPVVVDRHRQPTVIAMAGDGDGR